MEYWLHSWPAGPIFFECFQAAGLNVGKHVFCSPEVAIPDGQNFGQILQALAVFKIYTPKESSVEQSLDAEVTRAYFISCPVQISIERKLKTAGTWAD